MQESDDLSASYPANRLTSLPLALEKTIRLQMLRNHLRFFSRCLLVRACE